MDKIVIPISDSERERLNRQKRDDGFANKGWKEWLLSKAAARAQITEMEAIRQGTRTSLRRLWGMNMGTNLGYIRRKGTKSLRDIEEPLSKSVIVVGGGPSIVIHNQLETLKNSNYHGSIISSDRMLLPLLKMGIIPNYVLSVDGSPIILKFYRSKLFETNKDKIKILTHIAVNPKVIQYLYRQKVNPYWFLAHSVYVKEEEIENSDAIVTICMTVTKHNPHGIQTLVAAGNCGVCAFALSWVILKIKKICLIGFDMGYPEETPLHKTYYYSTFIETSQHYFGKNSFASLSAQIPYEREYNPVWKSYAFTDPVFRGYREMLRNLLDIIPNDLQIYSCVEGGALTHPRLKYMTFKQFLEENRN